MRYLLTSLLCVFTLSLTAQEAGCVNENATNYDSTATIDDGSCMYDQDGYDGAYAEGIASVDCPDGGSSCPGDLDNDGAVATSDLLMFLAAFGDTCEIADIPGCMDDTSCNYNTDATSDDGSCLANDECGVCGGDGSSCAEPAEFSVCGDYIGHEGYDYSTVLIGDQCWFSENCRYLPSVSPSSQLSTTSPYYYVYGYQGTDVEAAKSTDNYETYGVLYNWPAVITEGVCPSGWHISTDGEWQTMEIYYGMSEDDAASEGLRGPWYVGDALKSVFGWGSGTGGTYIDGFNGLPGGRCDIWIGGFQNIGDYGYWWSSSESSTDPGGFSYSWARDLYRGPDNLVGRYNSAIEYGFSARCVQD